MKTEEESEKKMGTVISRIHSPNEDGFGGSESVREVGWEDKPSGLGRCRRCVREGAGAGAY